MILTMSFIWRGDAKNQPTYYGKATLGGINQVCAFRSRHIGVLTDWYSQRMENGWLARRSHTSRQPRPHASMASEMGRPRVTSGALCVQES